MSVKILIILSSRDFPPYVINSFNTLSCPGALLVFKLACFVCVWGAISLVIGVYRPRDPPHRHSLFSFPTPPQTQDILPWAPSISLTSCKVKSPSLGSFIRFSNPVRLLISLKPLNSHGIPPILFCRSDSISPSYPPSAS